MFARRLRVAFAAFQLALFLLFGSTLTLAADASAPGDQARPEHVTQLLRASGVSDLETLARYRVAVEAAVRSAVERIGAGAPTYRRARRLHRFLHREHFIDYVAEADGLNDIVDDGRYNCLSATLFYALVARELGYEPQILALPGHVMLRLHVKRRTVDIEVTAPGGFDLARTSAYYPLRTSGCSTRGRVVDAGSRMLRNAGGAYWEVPLETAVGFAWINRAWAMLEEGNALEAAESVHEAGGYLRELTQRTQGLSRLLAQAFSIDYEAGRFERAYRVAEVEVGLFPSRTTARDRLLAAALKRIETQCGADEPDVAAAFLESVGEACPSAVDRARLDRRAWPLIATAAVRTGDRSLARTAAERYAEVEPDRVEVSRLRKWVDLRTAGEDAVAPATQVTYLPLAADFSPLGY